jgi:hypothetical protein
MKTKFVLITVMLCACHCAGQSNVVYYGTNASPISLAFADTNLSESAKSAITADLRVCLSEWGKKSELYMRNKGDSIGYLYNFKSSPHYPEDIGFPREIVNGASGLALHIPKNLSDAYTNAFAFAAANSNIVAAAYEFVAFVSSTNFLSVTSNQIANYFLFNQATPQLYQLAFHDLTNSVHGSSYYPPSVLGFHYSPEGPAPTNLWLYIPSSSPVCGYIEWGPVTAIWHDGKWKFSIWEKNPHYELPQ